MPSLALRPPSLPHVPVPHRTRHVWVGDTRAHLELRALDVDAATRFAELVVPRVAARPGVAWAEVNACTNRLVVAFEGSPDVDAVRDVLAAVEHELGVEQVPFPHDRPDHPGDDGPFVRQLVALGADVGGLSLGLALRAVRAAPRPVTVDVATLVSFAENVPRLRQIVEHRVGSPVADVGLAAAGALSAGLAQATLGPLVDATHRLGLVAESATRRRTWQRREPELCERPAGPEATAPPLAAARPSPLPAGPIERYAERAWIGSLAGFGVALPVTRSLERATGVLSAGLPKAARLGREAFATHLGRELARRGVVTLDPAVLRRLDRVDVVAVESELLAADEGLAALVERAGLELHVIDPHQGPPVAELRRLQVDGHVVLVVAARSHAALAAADVAVGVVPDDGPPPWAADLLCRRSADGLTDASLVVEACPIARDVSRQSATIALAGASVGGLMTFGALLPGAPMRVMTAVNLASLVAMANGTRAGLAVAHRPEAPPRDPTPWHRLTHAEALERLGSGWSGLDAGVADARAVLPPRPDPALVRVARAVGEELINPLTPILATGAGLSVAVGSVLDAALVTGVVGLNAVVGGVQRYRADVAIEELGRTTVQQVVVRRGGAEARVEASRLVPGDVIRLEAGEAVPADCRLLEARGLEVDESALTGESLPVTKGAAPTDAAAVADRTSMLYEGTSVAAGRCWAVVVAVGDATEARRALAVGRGALPETGVEARLRSLTSLTAPVAAGAGVGIIGLGLLRGRSLLELAPAGVSLTVAAVPEGLPLLATVAQLSAAKRLSARGALVRNPRAIEALGRVDVLCADKTGTLTEAKIRVGRVSDGVDDRPLDDLGPAQRQVLAVAVRATPHSRHGRRLPHPTDRAIRYAEAATDVHAAAEPDDWHVEADLPFEPGRGYHATLGHDGGPWTISVKGAPEVLLPACHTWREQPLDDDARGRLAHEAARLARAGYRVLVVADRDVPADSTLDDAAVTGLRFRGLLALTDPVRPTAALAVDRIRRAGVAVVMITGDHPSTAEGIATELGLLDGQRVLTGPELDALDDDQLDAVLPRTTVFARVAPSHKVRIVQAYQRAGRTVAMTGDGANDAPAIRLADVGIALGTRSTAAARDAADLVVLDDRIETIVDAIVEGRGMWGSVRDAVAMLVGSNLGEIGFTVAGTAVSGAPPVNARQLLLVNLLTDVAPAMAIALRPPRDTDPETLLREGPEVSLGADLERSIAVRAAATGTAATGAWLAARLTGTAGRASTVGLAALVGTQLGQTLALGGRDPMVLAAGLGSGAALFGIVMTPGLSQLFGCRPIGPVGWGLAATAATAGTVASVVVPRVIPWGR